MTTKSPDLQKCQESLQKKMPEGILVLRELNDRVEERRTFEISDRRLSAEYPVRKILWVIDIGQVSDRERADLLGRVQKLRLVEGSPQIRFTAPQDSFLAKESGDLYLIFPEYASLLSQSLPATEIDSRLAEKLLGQILEGLADLHRLEVAHGGVRPENICLSATQFTDQCSARLLGLNVIGRLENHSRAPQVDDATYHPPEWSQSNPHPTQTSDVYAFGVVACRLLFGPESVNSPANLENARKGLRKHRALKWIADALEPAPEKRPASALRLQELRRRMLHGGKLRKAAVLGAVVIVFGLGFYRPSTETPKPTTTAEFSGKDDQAALEQRPPDPETSKLRDTIQEAVQILQQSDGKVPQETLNQLRTVFQITDSQDLNEAREIWQQRDVMQQDAIKETDFKKKLGELSANDPRRNLLAGWDEIWKVEVSDKYDWIRHDLLAAPQENQIGRDRNHDRNVLMTFAKAPWDEKSKTDWKGVRGDYEVAAKIWRQAATDEQLTWDEFEKALSNATATHESRPRVKEVLSDWKQTFENRKSWTLKILDGKTPKAIDTYRVIAIYQHSPWAVTEGWFDSGSISETWITPTMRPQVPTEKISFEWKPGYPIRLMMWGESSLWYAGTRPELLDETIAGPIAIWNLRDPRSLTEAGSGASLTVSIQDCPGPPVAAGPIVRLK